MPRLRRAGLGLAIDSPGRDEQRPGPAVSPTLAALGGGAGVAVAGFLLALAATALAWLQSSAPFADAARTAAGVWLLAHGASATLGSVPVSIVPLGFTGLVVLMATGVAGFAASQRRLQVQRSDEPSALDPRREVLRLAGLFALGYVVTLLLVGALAGAGGQAVRALLGALLIGGGSAIIGSARGLRWRPWRSWPLWARALPAASAVAMLVLLTGASLVAGIAFTRNWHRVAALQEALHPGPGGGLVLALLQLAYLPNLVVWAGSWMLGAGVAIGQGTVVAPTGTRLGFVPSIPALGVLPSNGSGSAVLLCWLLVGVLAGALAAATVALSRRRARFDEVALVGGLAGVVCGLLHLLLAWWSGGALGTVRLTQVGPRLGALAILSPTLLGLSGLLTGGVIGLLRRPLPPPGDAADEPGDDDPSAGGVSESDDGTQMSFR